MDFNGHCGFLTNTNRFQQVSHWHSRRLKTMYLLNVYIYLVLCKSIKSTLHMKSITVVGIYATLSQGNFVITPYLVPTAYASIPSFHCPAFSKAFRIVSGTLSSKVSGWPLDCTISKKPFVDFQCKPFIFHCKSVKVSALRNTTSVQIPWCPVSQATPSLFLHLLQML